MIEWIKEQYNRLSRDEQAFVRLVLGVVGVLVLIVVLANQQAHATAYTATAQTGDTLTISDQKCSITSPWFKEWFDGTMIYKGKVLKVCWKIVGEAVVVIDSEGSLTVVPTQAFTKDVGS